VTRATHLQLPDQASAATKAASHTLISSTSWIYLLRSEPSTTTDLQSSSVVTEHK